MLKQTLLPNEVVICDDGSTDGTIDLLYQYKATAPFEVHIFRNPVQLGFNKNFEQVLGRCTRDLVFICDQDDYWMPEKLEVMAAFMAENPDAQIAFNNAFVADDELNNLHELFWLRVRFDEEAQQQWKNGEAMEVLLDGPRMMGCATVIRHGFIPKLIPIPTDIPKYIYDGCISLVGAAYDAIRFVDKPLQLYRTHNSQQIGVRAAPVPPRTRLRDRFTRPRAEKLEPLVFKRMQMEKIRQFLAGRVPENSPAMQQLTRKLAHYTMRSTLSTNRLQRIYPVLRDLQRGLYHRYADAATDWYSPYLAAIGDLLE
ncbi:glycosyl transferase family 2 [Arsenicibacter rosenii]|uniref:Glycosyl transferase family 2 n=1 Tax=Arsenicibacter rosenii TaxID=1750698 RepID=A0A1S2VR62_9BACT|nr:glycosyl transferase family 2 [Arsenicibacter rosenii]